MLSVADTAVSCDLEWNNTVLVFGLDETDDGESLRRQDAGQGAVVLAWLEDEIWEERGANVLSVDGKIHGHVAKIKGHDRWIRNDGVADHVGAVGEFVLLAEEDLDVLNLKTREFVEAWAGSAVVIGFGG